MTILRETTLKKPTFAKKIPLSMLVLRFNNRWRWCSGRFNFRLRRLELDYLRSHSCHVFYSVVVLIFFLSLRAIKTNHLLLLFGLMRLPLTLFPWALTESIKLFVSLKRINKFLNAEVSLT